MHAIWLQTLLTDKSLSLIGGKGERGGREAWRDGEERERCLCDCVHTFELDCQDKVPACTGKEMKLPLGVLIAGSVAFAQWKNEEELGPARFKVWLESRNV
jgi:hypothetical protein